ncbi:HEAT repeat domain-containing protein [Dactylosporangium sp. CS-047395]|uniref:HEAT repeat domain-containing protein n=1 Tax=Dactylosporangium sp. CS-047395 TaxID=3239936 RepID=UPI003D8F5975
MIETERDPAVLAAIAVAFGHIGDERCVEPLVRLHPHPDADVRMGVVFGLLKRPEPAALDALITLSADSDAGVRDWATFGLARQTTQDFPRLRAALAARLADEDPDARAEAIHGLSVRGDARALEPLLDALRSPEPISDSFVITEALYALAAATGDPRLHQYLIADREDHPDDEVPEALTAALARYA